MPYTINDSSLPSYVKKLSPALRKKWVLIFNSVFYKEGEKVAFLVANSWLKRNYFNPEATSVYDGLSVDNRSSSVNVNFVKSSQGLIKRADGSFTVDFMLSDDKRDSYGLKFSKRVLEKWARQINNGMKLTGDVDHKEYDLVADSTLSPEDAINAVKKLKRGIARAFKAYFKNGQLWLRAVVPSKYSSIIDSARGVSLEAHVTEMDESSKTVYDGTLGGFTFAKSVDPVNPRSVISRKKIFK